MKSALFIISLFLVLSMHSYAQQDPLFTQYMFNTLSINPAYAGSVNTLDATALYRKQWVNFPGAPTTQTLTVHSPMKNEVLCIGGTFINDAHGPVNQTGFYGDLAYRIFMDKSILAFGLKAGLNLYQANFTELNPLEGNDPSFATGIANKPLPNFGFGALWYGERFMLGVSAPKLMANDLVQGELQNIGNNKERQHFFLYGAYVWDLSTYVRLKPSVLFKAVGGAPPGLDLNANFLFYDKLWVGAMYRWEDALGGLILYEINNWLRAGYSYDFTTSEVGDYSSGSHEIMIGYNLYRPSISEKTPRFF